MPIVNGYLGCHTCRRRHQKCDEGKPNCFNCRLRGVQCEGYGITLTDFTVQSGLKGQMRAKLSRDGPEGNLQQNTVTNVADFSLDTDLHNVESLSQAPEENEMSFLEALSADNLNGHLIADFDMPTSSTDSNIVQCASANTWLPENDFLDDDTENFDCSLLDSFCEPYLYQAPADPFDQTLFCHCESMDIQHNHFPLSS